MLVEMQMPATRVKYIPVASRPVVGAAGGTTGICLAAPFALVGAQPDAAGAERAIDNINARAKRQSAQR